VYREGVSLGGERGAKSLKIKMPELLDAALSVKPGENGAEQYSNKVDVDKAPQGPKAPTMKVMSLLSECK
jgi:hypothetical protein